MCSRQIDIAEDDHFATVLIGLVDLRSREVTLANAGHPEPLLVTGGEAAYVPTVVGPPLGTWPAAYLTTTVTVAPGSMLLAYTDGLVERRGESLDVGLERLADAVRTADAPGGRTLDGVLDGVLERMVPAASEDDIALLALAWRDDGGT
jgi:serine phosphatase RsbU (regulator of sigma subunit)